MTDKKKPTMKKVELTEQEQANIEAKRLEDKKSQETAAKIQKILTEDKMQLQVNPNSPLNNLSILVLPARK